MKYFVPKLKRHLYGLNLSDLYSSVNQFKYFSAWWHLFDIQIVENLLEDAFFPKWMQQIYQEIGQCFKDNAGFEDLAEFYWVWREALSDLFFDSRMVLDRLTKALETMSKVLRLKTDVTDTKTTSKFQKGASFRELVQTRCENMGIIFLPGRFMNGKQLIKIGLHWCYIENSVLYKNKTEDPISLNDLEKLNLP